LPRTDLAASRDSGFEEREARLAHSNLFFHITAAFDEFQRELIVENTRAASRRPESGPQGGRPKVLDKERIRLAEAMLKDTVNYRLSGCHRSPQDREDAFYRYFPPDRIRELRNQL